MRIGKRIGFTVLLTSLILGFLIGEVAAGEKKEKGKKEKEEVVAVKKITGRVISLSPRHNPKSIGIAVDKENTDYFFQIGESIKILNKKKIVIGDTVELTYHKIKITLETKEGKEGKEKTKRAAKVIKFVESAEKVEGIYNSDHGGE